MNAPITVITATIPGREDLLLRNVRSVYAQTVGVENHLICAHPIGDDQPQLQYTRAKNVMLSSVGTEWVAVLNDDDYWLPHHVETVLPALEHADVVYSWDAGGTRPRERYDLYSPQELIDHFAVTNLLDGNCLVRVSMLRAVGGYPTVWEGPGPWEGGHFIDSPARWEDWHTFWRLSLIGARFACVPEETWVYGMGAVGQVCG